jgi:macrolide transport system ATP-binding/permease protein
MDSFFQDVRYSIRMLTKKPSFTLLAVLTLAIGIGASAAIFSVLDSYLLKPMAGRDNSKLEVVGFTRPNMDGAAPLSYPDFLDYRDNSSVFSGMAGYVNSQVGLRANGRSDMSIAHYVTPNFFTLLGVQPALGRFFLPGEGERTPNAPVIVLGYRYWQQRFGGDPTVIGRAVDVNGKPFSVIGVAPEEFHGPYTLIDTPFYIPIGMSSAISTNDQMGFVERRESHQVHTLAQPKDGVSREQARAALQIIAQRLDRTYPQSNHDTRIVIASERLARPEEGAASANILISAVFLGLVTLALLVTCVNVANLVLVRASGRAKEMAVRASLGARRGRLIRQLLTESLLLSLLGGVAGALFGAFLARLVAAIRVPGGLPIYWEFSFDWRVFACIGGVVVFCALVVGLLPALRASRLDLNTTLREGGRSDAGGGTRTRIRSVMVVAQVAGSLVVLIAAGLFIRSLQASQKIDIGFNPKNLLNVTVDPGLIGYQQSRSDEFTQALKEKVASMPGVQSASYAYTVPMGYDHESARIWKEGQAETDRAVFGAELNRIDEDFFRTVGVTLVRGRGFTQQDSKDSLLVAIVNQEMADRLWPNEDPIGHHFRYGKPNARPVEVVGVSRTGKNDSLTEDPSPYFYLPFAQNFSSLHILQVRTTVPPTSLAQSIEAAAREIDPSIPVYGVQTMEESLNGGNGYFLFRMGALFAGSLGALCLVLAVIGVYGVISYAANLRTHEIGVRMALGAQHRDVLKMVLGQGLMLVGVGLVVGLAMSMALTRFMRNLLFQIGVVDPVTFISVSAVLVGVAMIACYIPARRATKVDPLIALRYE